MEFVIMVCYILKIMVILAKGYSTVGDNCMIAHHLQPLGFQRQSITSSTGNSRSDGKEKSHNHHLHTY